MITGNKKSIMNQLEQTLEDGKYYAVDVMSPGEHHTKGQQDRFFKVCRVLAEESGYTLGEIKAVLINECFGEQRKISQMTTREMAELIDVAQRIAAEQGIYDIK